MAASAKSLEEVLREVTEELGRLNNDKSAVSLPRYTQYDGLRVIEKDASPPEESGEAASA
jgi:hypothetical protein